MLLFFSQEYQHVQVFLLYFSLKTKSSVHHRFLNIRIIFAARCSHWYGEYKLGLYPKSPPIPSFTIPYFSPLI